MLSSVSYSIGLVFQVGVARANLYSKIFITIHERLFIKIANFLGQNSQLTKKFPLAG
jgi:hypothetical protein